MIEINSKEELKKEVEKLTKANYMKDIYKAYKSAKGYHSYKVWMEFLILNSPFYQIKY